MDEIAELRRLASGYQVTQALHVTVALGLPDLIGDQTRSSTELADAAGADEPTLYRLLRAVAALGVLREEDGKRFALTPLGAALQSDAPQTLAGWVAFVGRPYHWNAWGSLLHSVRTGENAMRHTLGESPWEYRARHPEESEIFDRAMTDLTRVVDESVVSAYDFSRFGTIVDVAGGRGALLAAILGSAPNARGILFDQAHVVSGAAPILEAAGVADRCDVVAGSFFEAVPEGGDAYVLKFIVHDWEDAENVRILEVCRSAMGADGTLLVIERELGGPNERPDAKLSDLQMLVGPGGRERTLDEYRGLFAAAGFRLAGSTPTASGLSVLEAAPA